jgi:transcriptional regulator with XRE-family HTH domain
MSKTTHHANLSKATKAGREKLGISQWQLCAEIDEPLHYIGDLERGVCKYVSDDRIYKIAKALKLSPDYLFYMAGQVPPSQRHYITEQEYTQKYGNNDKPENN